jgi:signal peptide peptidase SppA
MEPNALRAFMSTMANGDWRAAGNLVSDDAKPDDAPPYDIENGVAHIRISGVLMPSVPWIMRAFGIDATGYDDICEACRLAAADPAVDSVCLDIDSPGGSVSGVHSTADAVDKLDEEKTVTARVTGMCASAGYWIAAKASKITADRGSMIGSIGVYSVVQDLSVAAANAGVKVHVISSSELKGAGVPGSQITDAQIADMQRMIDAFSADFVQDVADGRGKSIADILPSATGQVWMANEAQERGLIDGLTSDDIEDQERKNMDAFSLIQKHPAHAAMIAKLAQENATADAMGAAIAAADAAAALAALTDKADKSEAAAAAAKADADALKVKLAASAKECEALSAQLATLNALAVGGKAGAKVAQEGEPPAAEKLSPDAVAAMSGIERAKFFARGGTVG